MLSSAHLSICLSVRPPLSLSLPPLAFSIQGIRILSGEEVVTRQASSLLSWGAVLREEAESTVKPASDWEHPWAGSNAVMDL